MVTTVTSFGRSGLSDWLVQRVSAFVMTAYLIFIVGYLMLNSDLSYQQWAGLHSGLPMRMFSLLTMLSVAAHAWIGMWSVLTDYITVRTIGPKATGIRIFFQLGMIAMILLYLLWAIDILWRI
jgi:succinate dehydrogenase / fumarate reductase membrane anchor subunit